MQLLSHHLLGSRFPLTSSAHPRNGCCSEALEAEGSLVGDDSSEGDGVGSAEGWQFHLFPFRAQAVD